jgi:flagellar export protein FliJ
VQTRYTPLVKLKKNTMDQSERAVSNANVNLNSASTALEMSYKSLDDIELPSSGTIAEMLASRTLLDSQRGLIQHNKEWIEFAKKQLEDAKDRLKLDMIDFEKFKHLELQEIKKALKEKKIQESKDLDEIALMTFSNNNKKGYR